MNKKNFSILGGDLRNVKLAESLKKDGHEVRLFGFDNARFEIHIDNSRDLKTAIDDSDAVIGPIPCSNDDETLNAPFHSGKIFMNDVFRTMNKNQLFIAGRISNKLSHLAQVCNVYFVDLLEREEMAVLNAIPTAEGAIQLAMEEMPITLHGCNALILGYGRIGKTLADKLKGLGANVYVEARKFSDIAWIRSYGYHPVFISALGEYLPEMNVIFNTIPSLILNADLLKLVNSECLIIDLASKPGGLDFDKAREMGLKTIWALSLPGKVAPVTAANFIKDTVYNILEELGV